MSSGGRKSKKGVESSREIDRNAATARIAVKLDPTSDDAADQAGQIIVAEADRK